MTTFRFKTEEEAKNYSAEIPWALAEPLITEYYLRPDALKVALPDGVVTILKSYRFSADDIRRLIDQDQVTDLTLMFATSPTNPTNITIIAGGIIDPDNTGGELVKGLLYDYCEPCPTKCATNM